MLKTPGRVLLSVMFIYGGWGAFHDPGHRVELVEAAGIPEPRRATILNGAIMMVAGIMLAANVLPKLAATILIGSLLPTTFVGHPFWKEKHPAGRAGQSVQFNKNLSMLGGLLLVLADNSEEKQ